MTGPRRAALAVAAGLVAVLLVGTGCGVPTSSGVQYLGPGPEAGSTARGGGKAPPLADDATTPREQVDNFLQAAAGSPDTAPDRVREYLRSAEQSAWQPPEPIRVVRLLQEPFVTDDVGGGWLVELTAQLVGELHPHGYLDAPTVSEPVDYQFRVVTEAGPDGDLDGLRLRIAEPPPYLLLQDTALTNDNYYYPHSIYFWDADRTALVPDLRWLPTAGESADQHPWTVVRWLLAGPAPSLSRVEGLPTGTSHQGTPLWDEDNQLVVNFNTAAVEGQDPDLFATQLAWSLLPLRPGAQLELRIDDRAQDVLVSSRRPPPVPSRLVLLDGVARPYAADQQPVPPVLSEQVNQDLRAAALTSNGEIAALVRVSDDGGQELTVARALAGVEPSEQPTGLVADQLSQPVWLGTSGTASGLVVADGELRRFTSTGQESLVSTPGLAGPITAVAVAPERRRLALIAGDRLYVAQLRFDRESVTVHSPRVLPTTVRRLAGVAFTHEHSLVIAGERDGRVGLYELTVDGAREQQRHDLSNASVTALVAHPMPDPGDPPMVMYEANGQAYLYSGVPHLIQPDDLFDPPESVESPPRAPFFAS